MWTIPNILTVLRLLAAVLLPFVFLYVARPYADWMAVVLFVGVALTDWLDGWIARAWNQTSKLGAMLDPIADKAMVAIALLTLVGLNGMAPFILIPATLILFREVFVSGLREYLGQAAGTLAVTKAAKWKTTLQMVAISALLAVGIFEHELGMRTFGMDPSMVDQVLDGGSDDPLGLRFYFDGMRATWFGGIGLLWAAMVLTIYTGYDYLRKAWPLLRDG